MSSRSFLQLVLVVSALVLSDLSGHLTAQDNLLLEIAPSSSQSAVNQTGWTYSQTNGLDLSGSTWIQGIDENDVYHAALKHDQVTGPDNQDWEIRIGKGGQIYSIVSEVGEIVPPQRTRAPWIDEVFQTVAVDTRDNVNGAVHFYHQSGYYVEGEIENPTYSPLLASGEVGSGGYATVNLMVEAHSLDEEQQPSRLLNWQSTKDLGDGVIEVTSTLYNFGEATVNFMNMPWGGSRYSVFNNMLVSNPDGTFESKALFRFNQPENQLVRIEDTDGWVAFSEGIMSTDRALALVVGDSDPHFSEAWQYAKSDWRWGDASAGGTNTRDYLVGTLRRRLNIDANDVFYSRYYMVLGDISHIQSTINGRGLVADATYDKIEIEEAGGSPLLAWKIIVDQGTVSLQEATATDADFQTFAHPVNGSQPLFLLEDASGMSFISTDPYAISDFPYDEATVYNGLLGFVMPESLKTDVNDYNDLEIIFSAHTGFYHVSSSRMFAISPVSEPLLGDTNLDGAVNFFDISPFIALLSGGTFQVEGDIDQNGTVDFLDIAPFIAILSGQ